MTEVVEVLSAGILTSVPEHGVACNDLLKITEKDPSSLILVVLRMEKSCPIPEKEGGL